jgi:hypothetical protein
MKNQSTDPDNSPSYRIAWANRGVLTICLLVVLPTGAHLKGGEAAPTTTQSSAAPSATRTHVSAMPPPVATDRIPPLKQQRPNCITLYDSISAHRSPMMEFKYGQIRQAGVDATGRVEIGLKTTPAAGVHDFWGGALRVSRSCNLVAGKAVLLLDDGHAGDIFIDAVCNDGDESRIITFFGCTPLQRPICDPSHHATIAIGNTR